MNQTEATALIASQLQERIRDGRHSVAELMQHGKTLLGRKHVLPAVAGLLHEIQVEGTFPDGCVLYCRLTSATYPPSISVFLVTVHDPICTEAGDLEAALYGSFLPVPSQNVFPAIEASEYARHKAPGAVIAKKERILINAGRARIRLAVTNNGDRPIQVSKSVLFFFTPFSDASIIYHRSDHTITSLKQMPF